MGVSPGQKGLAILTWWPWGRVLLWNGFNYNFFNGIISNSMYTNYFLIKNRRLEMMICLLVILKWLCFLEILLFVWLVENTKADLHNSYLILHVLIWEIAIHAKKKPFLMVFLKTERLNSKSGGHIREFWGTDI